MDARAPVDVTLITGFLGSGKTTAIRHLVRTLPSGTRVAIVINDFGEAEIDRATLGESGVVIDISGACVCCTAPEGFVAAVGRLLDEADRIFVEPTGLARPADLIDTLRRAPYADRLALGPLVVLLDPHALAIGAIPAPLLASAAHSDVLVASRTDLATPAELDAFDAWIRALDPGPARVLRIARGQLPHEALSWPEGSGPRAPAGAAHHAHAHEDHGHAVRTWIWPPDAVFDRERLRALLAPPLVRAKGLLRTDEGWLALQLAGGRLHEEATDWRRDSRLDVFADASDGARALDALDAALAAALLDETALAARGTALEIGGRTVDRDWLRALPDPIPDVSALVPGRAGSGVRLREILRAAGVALRPDQRLVIVARDGFATPPTPADELADGVLVHSLGDGPLPDSQGGPFRLLVPGRTDACGNVKGVVRLALREGA